MPADSVATAVDDSVATHISVALPDNEHIKRLHASTHTTPEHGFHSQFTVFADTAKISSIIVALEEASMACDQKWHDIRMHACDNFFLL